MSETKEAPEAVQKAILAFGQIAGEYGLSLLMKAAEETDDMAEALKTAYRQYNRQPVPPPTEEDQMWAKVDEALAGRRPAEAAPATKPSPVANDKQSRPAVKPSPFANRKSLPNSGSKAIQCECGDSGCPCQGTCRAMATHILNCGGSNFRFCERCAEDSVNCGLDMRIRRPIRVQAPEAFRADPTIRNLIETARNDESVMPVLADALEERGYSNRGILRRLREQDRAALQYLHL